MWPTCKNKQKDQIICKPIGYVITACSGLGYCQIDFSENLSFEKYVDILCLLPLRQTVCSSLQHAAGCAACQQRCNVLQISAPGKAMVAATVKRIETSSSWLPSCFPSPRSSCTPRQRGYREGCHHFHPAYDSMQAWPRNNFMDRGNDA